MDTSKYLRMMQTQGKPDTRVTAANPHTLCCLLPFRLLHHIESRTEEAIEESTCVPAVNLDAGPTVNASQLTLAGTLTSKDGNHIVCESLVKQTPFRQVL